PASMRDAFGPFRTRARQTWIRGLGFDPDTGQPLIAGADPLASVSDEKLALQLFRLVNITYALNDSDAVRVIPANEQAAIKTIMLAVRERLVRGVAKLSAPDPFGLQAVATLSSGIRVFEILVLLYGIDYSDAQVLLLNGNYGTVAGLTADLDQNL